jgi:hypothetical protein
MLYSPFFSVPLVKESMHKHWRAQVRIQRKASGIRSAPVNQRGFRKADAKIKAAIHEYHRTASRFDSYQMLTPLGISG